MSEEDKIIKVARVLKDCQSIFFITGAGISADSGLPTYRGIGGLYNDKITEDGISVEVALAGETLRRRPEITWKYLSQIEYRCRNAKYNPAHEIIARMEECFGRVWVLTQNIDGFHQQAGSKNVIDIHGDMHNLICPACGWQKRVKDYSNMEIPPHCPQCSSVVRPDVVFFGEMLPPEKLDVLYRELSRGFDIYFSIGTSGVFPYIKAPIIEAQLQNKHTVEINPSNTEISNYVDIKIKLRAAEALRKIWAEFLRK